MDDREATLMMHYLDHVFAIQFPFYTPSSSGGGRGWLLSLLIRTKPLYHAALSLGAFHQQSLFKIGPAKREAQKDILQELEKHHQLTLRELQLFIQHENPSARSSADFSRNVQILACTVQLISFEV